MKKMARYRTVAFPYGWLLVLVMMSITLCACSPVVVKDRGPSLVTVMKEDPRDTTRYLRLSSAELAGEATGLP